MKLSKKDIREMLIKESKADIAIDSKNYDSYLKLKKALESWEGKIIGKNLEKHLRKVLNDDSLYITSPLSWYSLKFNDCNFTLGYHSSGNLFQLSEFLRCNTHANEEEHHRIENNTNNLNNKKLIDDYVKYFMLLQEAFEIRENNDSLNSFYTLEKQIGLKLRVEK